MASTIESNCAQEVPRAERIARLNDTLRKTGTGGRIMITRGVRVLSDFEPSELVQALAAYDQFDHFNDPHGERDGHDHSLILATARQYLEYQISSSQAPHKGLQQHAKGGEDDGLQQA